MTKLILSEQVFTGYFLYSNIQFSELLYCSSHLAKIDVQSLAVDPTIKTSSSDCEL